MSGNGKTHPMGWGVGPEFDVQPPLPGGSVVTTIPGAVAVSLTDFRHHARKLHIVMANISDRIRKPNEPEAGTPDGMNIVDEVDWHLMACLRLALRIKKELEADGTI